MQGANIEVRVISCRPMGVASSRNFAAAQATGRLLCALDNDASFDSPDSLESIKKAFDSNHRLGVISFRILRGDASEIDPFAWVFRRSPPIWADREFHKFTFTGGGFCARKEAFWAAGGFWDHLKYSREEEDLGLALLDKGWHIVYNSKVIVRHYADPGGRINLVQRRLFELRNGICRFLC